MNLQIMLEQAAFVIQNITIFLVSSISSNECNNKQIMLSKKEASYVSTQLASSCPSLRHLTFKVSQGQTMNISLWSFTGERGSELGSVTGSILCARKKKLKKKFWHQVILCRGKKS